MNAVSRAFFRYCYALPHTLFILFLVLASACSKPSAPPAKQAAPPSAEPSDIVTVPVGAADMLNRSKTHHHEAPHGGTLVLIGDHAGHLEFVLDGASGTLTTYAFDGETENAVRLNSIGIAMQVMPPGKPAIVVQLRPAANVLTGETAESSSQYAVQSDELKGVTEFVGVIPELGFRGMEIDNVTVSFPGGNE